GPTQPIRRRSMSASSRVTWSGWPDRRVWRSSATGRSASLAPGALQRLVGLPLLGRRNIVAGKGLRVLARVALDPGEDQALRHALAALLGFKQHLGRSGGTGFGIAVVLDRRSDLANGPAGRLVLGIPFGEGRE